MPDLISSPANPRIKDLVKLRDGKHRRRTGLFLIDGVREAQRALRSGVRFQEIFLLKDRADARTTPFGLEPPCRVTLVSESVFAKIAFGSRHEGIVVAAQAPDRSLDRFSRTVSDIAVPLFAVLEGIEKPGNLGAIFRSADGAGLDGVLIASPGTDLENPATIRSSLGTVFRLPAAVVADADALTWLYARGLTLAAARCDGAIPYTDYDFRRPTAIVLGSEADGLSARWHAGPVVPIALPMLGIADSLNVSNAAAVLFYEARRQREM